jgi:hypothetical protein
MKDKIGRINKYKKNNKLELFELLIQIHASASPF